MGPALGACLAVGFYRLVKVLEYETANPGQDFDDKEAEVFNPDDNPARAEDVARPAVIVGDPDYVSDHRGTRSTRDVGGRPGSFGSSTVSPIMSRQTNPSQYDGAVKELPARTRSKVRGDTYDSATRVEEGTMGGNYTVSGLRGI